MDYSTFLESKRIRAQTHGIDVDPSKIHPSLFPFQRDTTLWSLRKGCSLDAIDTGLGKSRIEIEWMRLLVELGYAKRGLIVAPLSVARQTVREAKKIDVDLKYIRGPSELNGHGLYITNYEMVDHFDPTDFGAIALDEASILKGIAGKYRQYLTKRFANIPFRSCHTATPAPNDDVEIGTYSEYLGVNTRNEMLSMFFINANKVVEDVLQTQDGRNVTVSHKGHNKDGQEWRLRNYGKIKFYEWLSSWALMMTIPSDLGYSDEGYILPPLNIQPLFVDADYVPEGQLFFTKLKGIQDRTKVRRSTLAQRVSAAADIANASNEQWIAWCGLDEESKELARAIHDNVEVKGSDSPEYKAEMLEAFQDGKYKCLVSKGKIAGYGMNFQNSHNMAFVGLNDSFELLYQCIRRQHRFGQQHRVNVHVILSEIERGIWDNVMRKERMANKLKRELIANIKLFEEQELGTSRERIKPDYLPAEEMILPAWLTEEK